MSDGPERVGAVGSWILERWAYDGAALEARRPAERYFDETTVEIDATGDLEIVVYARTGSERVHVPRDVLIALLRDAIDRGVLDLTKHVGSVIAASGDA